MHKCCKIVFDDLADDPVSPPDGCMWYRSDLQEFRIRDSGVTKTITAKDISGSFRTIWIAAGSFAPRATNGATAKTEEYTTNDINLDQYLFDSATEEGVQVQISMPDMWDKGTILAKVYWDAVTGASAADKVSWGIRGGALSNDEAIDTALGTQKVVDDVMIAVGDLHITPVSTAITISGTPALNDMIVLQVVRNVAGNDDMTEDAKFLGLKIQYKELVLTPSKWT